MVTILVSREPKSQKYNNDSSLPERLLPVCTHLMYFFLSDNEESMKKKQWRLFIYVLGWWLYRKMVAVHTGENTQNNYII